MPEARRGDAAEHARQSNLTARGRQQVDAANHVADALQVIVYGRRELIAPVAEAIANQQVPALEARLLFLRPEQFVEKSFDAWLHAHTPTHTFGQRNLLLTTRVGIALAVNLVARAGAGVYQLVIDQRLQGLPVNRIPLTLPHNRAVWNKTQPGEIINDRRGVFGPRALPIVILDPQQHLAAALLRGPPDVEGVYDVTQVQVAGRRRRKACQHAQSGYRLRHAQRAETAARPVISTARVHRRGRGHGISV